MRLRRPITVTVQRPALQGRGGDPVGAGDEFTIEQCAFFADKASENNDRRETVMLTGTLVTPRSGDLRATDHVIIPGWNRDKPFNVVGDPEWDQAAPGSGKDFGHKWFQVRAVR